MTIAPHPLLDPRAFVARFPSPLSAVVVPGEISGLLSPSASAPVQADDAVRAAVCDLLRHGGVKPTGRTKTHGGTTRTLSIVWGSKALPGQAEATARWYRSLLESGGAQTEDVDA